MIKIDHLRSQHDDALAMAERLLDLVDQFDRRSAAIPVLMQLNRLLGLLRVHLALEEVQLSPLLMASPDSKVARTARRHADERDQLAIDLECFARSWPGAESIAANFDRFRDAAHQLVLALAVRIERENLYLYPLAEAEAQRQAPQAA